MRQIVLLHHAADSKDAKAIWAHLSKMLDRSAYSLWTPSSYTAFGAKQEQLHRAVATAWVVLVMVGTHGIDEEFENLTAGAIHAQVAELGRAFGRLRIDLPGQTAVPSVLRSWVPVTVEEPVDYEKVAQAITAKLGVEPQWTSELAVDDAKATLPSEMRRSFTEVASTLAARKPLTVLIGPYAPVEENDDGSCPSRIRSRLRDMIDEGMLKAALGGTEDGAPLMWQDHLATLCLLSDHDARDITRSIEDVIREAPGDEIGPPGEFHAALADFALRLQDFQYGKFADTGLPAITLISFCPGLRIERSLVARSLSFERAALQQDEGGALRLVHQAYTPTPAQAQAALSLSEFHFMPSPRDVGERCGAIRLIKLAGSRDLDDSIATHLAQSYLMLSALLPKFERLVGAVAAGPYVALGGGLTTPPLQGAHSILLRQLLDRGERRPRLAIVPDVTASPDPLRRAESEHLERLARAPGSGFNRIELVRGSPLSFLKAISIALKGAETA